MSADIETLERRLRAIIAEMESAVVAFSGGIDSALVLAIASRELRAGAIGVTGVSLSLSKREREGAAAFAASIGAQHAFLETQELQDERYARNAANRCYFCKNELYGKLVSFARDRGVPHVLDGSNLDDTLDYRPGRTAASEYGIRSPLIEAQFTKANVRALAERIGLPIWDKPALACLSSRFPHGTRITAELLGQVERAEDVLYAHGLRQFRVRHHGDVARIEIPEDEFGLIIDNARRSAILEGVRQTGYAHVTLDLAGYRKPAATPASEKYVSLL